MPSAKLDLPFELTGSKVTEIEWPLGGVRFTLTGKTDSGNEVNAARLTFERVSNLVQVRAFLTTKLSYLPAGTRRKFPEYRIAESPIKLPARLTCLRLTQAAKLSYGDRVFSNYHGKPFVGAKDKVYLFSLAAPRFRDREPFPIACSRVAFVQADGPAPGHEETPPATIHSFDALQPIAREFAEAIFHQDLEKANRLLTPEAQKILKKQQLKRFLPRGWKSFVDQYGDTDTAIVECLKILTIEPHFGGTDDLEIPYGPYVTPDVTVDQISGVLSIFAGDPDWDIDPMCSLYFVNQDGQPRIGIVY